MDTGFLSSYPAKLMEYGLAAAYLALFVPFWKYVQGGTRKKRVARARARSFALPGNAILRPKEAAPLLSGEAARRWAEDGDVAADVVAHERSPKRPDEISRHDFGR